MSQARGVVILGGVAMKERALARVASTLYPGLPATLIPHGLFQLVNVRGAFAANTDALARAIDANKGGSIVHIFSGSAFFSVPALAKWKDERVKGVILDSIPFERREKKLMRVAGLPEALCGPAGAVARAILVSKFVGATIEYTDMYFSALADARTFSPASRVMVACSKDDVITPVEDAQKFFSTAEKAWQAQPGAPTLSAYWGVGSHALMARDDAAGMGAAVRDFLKETDFQLR